MRGISVTVGGALADVESAVRSGLAEEGFGILTEIDVAATLKDKLGVERPPLKILGACNPSIAHQALERDPSAALILPCNVVIEPADDDRTRVTFADPRQLIPDRAMKDLVDEASSRLEQVAVRLGRIDEEG